MNVVSSIPTPLLILGARGLLGQALVRSATASGQAGLIAWGRAELDLRDAAKTDAAIAASGAQTVILAAARVGGIHANSSYPVEFLGDNLAIYSNVIHAAYRAGVKRLIFVGSNCSYPRNAPQPIGETSLFQGEVEPTNSAFAQAKLAAIELCRAYNQQYGTRYLTVMPTSLYGPGDNYDPQNSHVMAAMIRRFVAAKAAGSAHKTIRGLGKDFSLARASDTPRFDALLSAKSARLADAALAGKRFAGLEVRRMDAWGNTGGAVVLTPFSAQTRQQMRKFALAQSPAMHIIDPYRIL